MRCNRVIVFVFMGAQVQSVLSETDKESLDLAMSMMGPQELTAVEEEVSDHLKSTPLPPLSMCTQVRRIQSNVRTWLLRKNYTNLRDAARTLQVAWRERRGTSSRLSTSRLALSASGRRGAIGQRDGDSSLLVETTHFDGQGTIEETGEESGAVVAQGDVGVNDINRYEGEVAGLMLHADDADSKQVSNTAAATLQRATRGMLARKSFRRVKQQAMASLVIQKSLFTWWIHKGHTHI